MFVTEGRRIRRNPEHRVPAVATLLFAIEMLVLLLLVMTVWLVYTQIHDEEHLINAALTAGLERAAVTPVTQAGAYDNVGWNGAGVTLTSSQLPVALSTTLQSAVPGSTTQVEGQSVQWQLPAATAAAWHVTAPITISALQATSGPDQPVTVGSQTTTYGYPVIAGAVKVPVHVVSLDQFQWTATLTESFVLPLAGRENPTTIRPLG
ncbi:hypothetical protein BXT84_00515 [Sulfobacillus thermotolerans]|uniref:Uncharacterized protein n=1 Tax=Sulfobacillus thermotolerans TaxID=338644 RepID=A0ABN5GZ34_9FIRM|nr:hypothetical protein BXT84_00515 [Sulfobacillus thermotolerans]